MAHLMQFTQPGWLVLLALIPVPLILERARPRILWPSFADLPLAERRRTGRLLMRCVPALLRGLALGALGLALARPQSVGGVIKVAGQGLAIVVAFDQSSSMKTADFPVDDATRRISRLDAAKATFIRFVESRPDDLIGLVVFADYPDLSCPPTLDHRFLVETVQAIRPARPADDGTNIGDAIAWALQALRKTTPSKRVLVLLTDGNNEPGVPHPLDPQKAAELARDLGVVLHTIAIGRPGGIVRDTEPKTKLPILTEIEGPNIPLLERLAIITGGRSFVATDSDALDDVFRTISALEKSPIKGTIRTRYDEHFSLWAGLALAFLLLDRLLVAGVLRRLP
jgi:Ca-activated chloride channel family protein